MEFLNLTIGQFLTLFGAVSAVSVALYMLDRARRRQVVATLRFWVAPGQPAPVSRRRRIQQPWSLLLQLLGMALLLLAIAEFQFGGSLHKRRDHVLVLDTSAWMGASLPGHADTTLMDLARANALGWLRAVPASDRVLVVRADGLATPATAWESDRRKTARAILESQPGATALNLAQNLEFARELQRRSGADAGEIVYAGPGSISAREAGNLNLPAIPALRVLAMDDAVENCGLRSMGARRSETNPGTWEVLVRVRNYGRTPRVVNVTLNFGKAPQGLHPVEVPAGAEKETSFTVHTAAAGILEARLYPRDAFAADNYASLELPQGHALRVVVYSDQPEAIRPALLSDPRVEAEFHTRAQYTASAAGKERLVVIDRFLPETRPEGNVLWIDPPAEGGPARIRERLEKAEGLRWAADEPLTQGLRARNMQIEGASVFEAAPGDIRVAETERGPVMIARMSGDGRSRMVAIGFNPFAGAMRFELATPLLLANVLRWMAPDLFRDVDVATQSAGAVSSPLEADADKRTVHVVTDAGRALPFNIRDRAVQFFEGESARVSVISGNTERVYSLTLPELGEAKWTPSANVLHGIPAWTDSVRRSTILWPFLALAGAALLVAEWLVYGSYTASRLRIVKGAVRKAA